MPLYQLYQQILLQQSVIHADETPLKVINEDKVTSYMWVYCTGRDSSSTSLDRNKPPNLVLYDFQNNRAGQCARDYLKDFSGYLQVDGYAGYGQSDATLVGCWAHARRNFIEAQKTQVKGKIGKADWAISHIRKLYRIEVEIKQKNSTGKAGDQTNPKPPVT